MHQCEDKTVAKPQILIVDDISDNLLSLEKLLKEFEIDLFQASSGREAVSLTKSNKFALIILDVHMPGIDGFKTAELIRYFGTSKYSPIIFITGSALEDEDIFKGYEVGAVDYILRPVNSYILKSKVKIFLEMYKQKALIEDQRKKLEEDLSFQKRISSDFEIAKQQAEEANSSKSIFLANMSHEIRTPMNAIIGSSKMLIEMMHTHEQRKYLDIIIAAGNNLLTIINDILDLSKIEAGKIDIEYKDTLLSGIVNDVKNILYPLALSKGIELICEQVNKDFPVIKTDHVRLKQVLLNLGNNALKFTDHGSVSIDVSMEKKTNTLATLCFSVKDTGVGIQQDKINQLFKPFSQVSKVKTAGTGLGLIISKKIVELMGGTIHFESEEGKGSKFWFVIPFEKGSLSTTQLKSIENNHDETNIPINLNILVAEDNFFNQEIIKGYLKNHQVTLVNNGKEAVEILENTSFDVILMDIQMPEMDGITATKRIRDQNSKVLNHNIPIIAMTAYAMKEDRDLCLNSGMNGYVSKPVNCQSLNSEFKRVLLKSNYQSSDSPQIRFNQHAFMSLMRNDKSLALKLIVAFVDNISPKSMAGIKNAIENKDAKNLEAMSHKFKGSIGYFSDAGKELTYQLQELAHKQDFSTVNEVYELLKKEVENLIPQLRDLMREMTN